MTNEHFFLEDPILSTELSCDRSMLGDSSVVRAPKGLGFESQRDGWDKFLLQDQLSVPTHFGIRSTPVLPQ